MRKFLALVLASTFLAGSPVVYEPAEARSLFESLFPKAAERRRERRLRKSRRQELRLRSLRNLERRRLKAQSRKRTTVKAPVVKSKGFKTYVVRGTAAVPFTRLAKAFSAEERRFADQRATPPQVDTAPEADDPQQEIPVVKISQVVGPDVIGPPAPLVVEPTPSVVEDVQTDREPVEAVRLSAGGNLLSQIKLRVPSSLRTPLVSHYRENPHFLWIGEDGKPTAKALEVVAVLNNANAFGLSREHYVLPEFSNDIAALADDGAENNARLLEAMNFEFALTARALQYANDARHGLVDPNRISDYHDFKNLQNNHLKTLAKLTAAGNATFYLEKQHPQDASFEHLRKQLVLIEEEAARFQSVEIARGTFLKPGQTNEQLENIVESIRRKADEGFLNDHFDVFARDHSQAIYEGDVVDMVRAFQKTVGLKPDGIVGKRTIAKLKVGNPKEQKKKIEYAMERLRWHPESFGRDYVFINQPAYRATLMRNNKEVISMRTVVGKTSNQTNFFHDTIEYVEYNPYWGVPRSILVNEMLPKLRRNASYLDNLGYEITTVSGRRISSSNVDWWSVGADFPYNVRQPPGPKNALGELKIMFPNKHAIYMHDTPARQLFSRNERAYSHGCVRLAEPRKMAAAVLGTSVDTIASNIANGANKTQKLSSKLPVYVSYFTAWPKKDGTIEYYKDVYGRDRALGKALELERNSRRVRS